MHSDICRILRKEGRQPARRDERGATMLEAAITLPLFLIVIFVGLELLRLSVIVLATQISVIDGIRRSITGDCGESTCTTAKRLAFAKNAMIQRAGSLGVKLKQEYICIQPAGGPNCNPLLGQSPGRPREFIVGEVVVPVQLIIGPKLPFVIRASAVGRNEPFPE